MQGWERAKRPYQFEDPSPKIPTYRKKEEKGKTVEDKKLAAWANKKALALLLNLLVQHHKIQGQQDRST